jgi:hypothetical protein
MVRIYTDTNSRVFSQLHVEGANQTDGWQPWDWSGYATSVTTNGWWWKWEITIRATLTNGEVYTCSAYVPQFQWFNDVVHVKCP